MTMTEEYSPAKLRLVCRAMCALSLVLLFFVRAGDVLGQQAIKRPVGRAEKPAKVAEKSAAASQGIPDLTKDFILNFGKRPVPERMPGVSLAVDWTTCQVHRVNNHSPLSITLNGNITSDIATIWTLTPQAVGPANLNRVENVMGRHDAAGRTTVPLTWTISLDGGAFEPMHVTPDYTVTTVFPPGMHTFKLQISGPLQPNQPNGYYRLQLAQNLMPQL